MNIRRKILLIILLSVFLNANSQNNIYGEIEYTYATNIFKLFTQKYKMKFNDSLSFSLETDIKKTSDKSVNITEQKGVSRVSFVGRKNLTPQYYYHNRSKNEFYFRKNYYNETLLVKEEEQDWDWILTEETQLIGRFVCKKATTKFRGRNYTAWYTEQIPLPYGPWKLNGLPGLILEAYDDDGVFQLYATRITIKKNDTINIDFDLAELEKAMTIKDYISRRIELVKADLAELSSKLPKGSKPIEYNENCDDCRDQIEYFNKD